MHLVIVRVVLEKIAADVISLNLIDNWRFSRNPFDLVPRRKQSLGYWERASE